VRSFILLLGLLLVGGCGGEGESRAKTVPVKARPDAPFHFVDTAEAAGLRTITWCGRPEKPHLLESGGTGVALFDYDGDGDLDLYLVNGWRLEGSEVVERGRDVLYRNRGDGTFEDVTREAGLGLDAWGCGVAVGDIDGDGHPDLFVTNFGPDLLYRNNGDGTFSAVPDSPGIDGWSAPAVFFDADGDGDQDLFVGGYVEATLEEVLHAKPTLSWKDRDVMLGPFGLEGLANRYFENDGRGRFVEATDKAGLTDVGEYFSFAVAALDVDDDNDLDLYVANDSNPNYLYQNDGSGRFQEVGLWSGAAFDVNSAAQAGMGVVPGDFDNDGKIDLFVANFAQDSSTLYVNAGDCLFVDESQPRGLRDPTYGPLSWGGALADFDLDGDLDIFVANGHIYPQADDPPPTGTSFAQPNLVLANHDGHLQDVSRNAGPGLEVVRSSRGSAVGDIDGDGDLDLVIANVDTPPTLLRNDTQPRGAWLLVSAAGAHRVEVTAGGRRFVRPYVSGGSYVSASDPRFHFGLGEVERVERLAVRWADGSETELTDVAVDQLIEVNR
jgi:hypothetical protein